MQLTIRCAALAILLGATLSTPALAADCGKDGAGFDRWLGGFKTTAEGQGISSRAVETAFAGVSYDPKVIGLDRNQRQFRESFAEFSGRMIPPRMGRAKALLSRNAGTLARIEKGFGVPGPVLVAIWGLETDFGVVQGNMATIRSLATLAYDCRRADLFRGQLLDALRIVDRGDLSPAEMRGGWAGELGQTQFLPSSYVAFAVDFDGNGKRDLIHNAADVLASTASYLKGHGWKAGQPWGVGSANFNVLLAWNKAPVYAKTVAEFARRLSAG